MKEFKSYTLNCSFFCKNLEIPLTKWAIKCFKGEKMKSFILIFFVSLSAFASFNQEHSQWDTVLKKYTVKDNHQVLFKYKKLKGNEAELDTYLGELENVSKIQFAAFTREEQLAFWINAYNAYTIKIVLEHYPVKSIRDIDSGLFSSGPWKKKFIPLFGKKMSLDEIEHETIREQFKEPRIHFAVNCASISCPALLQEAFVASKLEKQFDMAAMNFLTDTSKNEVKGKALHLSKIFKWYGDDFNQKHGGFEEYVIKTLNLPKLDYEVEFKDYDWNLNESK